MELISIGNELLLGHTINTNASLLAEAFLKEGWAVSRITTIGDEKEEIQSAVEQALERSHFVVVTGGLGPTHDDITTDAIEEILGKPSATIPNHLGTAPGFIYNSRLLTLPGVPQQMEPMLYESVIPFFKKHLTEKHYTKSLYFCLLAETDIEFPENPDVTMSICPSYGRVSIYLFSENEKALEEVAMYLKKNYGSYLYSTTDRRLEVAIQKIMVEKKLTLACAESCTGGEIAARLTKIPGASTYFLGSIVSYSNEMKHALLGVTSIETQGAVSKETVIEMAQGLDADYVIAVSGIAGPTGGTPEKPVGTVWLAYGKKDSLQVETFVAKGSRDIIINYTTTTALGKLWTIIS